MAVLTLGEMLQAIDTQTITTRDANKRKLKLRTPGRVEVLVERITRIFGLCAHKEETRLIPTRDVALILHILVVGVTAVELKLSQTAMGGAHTQTERTEAVVRLDRERIADRRQATK